MQKYLRPLGSGGCLVLVAGLAAAAALLWLFGYQQWAAVLLVLALLCAMLSLWGLRLDQQDLQTSLKAAIEQGHLESDRSLKGPLAVLQPALDELLRLQARRIEALQATLTEMQYSAQELSVNAQQVVSHSKQQSEATASAAAAATEISQSSDEVTGRIAATRDAAQGARELCENGDRALDETRQQAEQVSKVAAETGRQLSSLEGSLESVVSMSFVIREIAEQTNLLALNAAIEAARAGEYGRGFAVVADEVRALAQRSQESANAITRQTEVVTEDMAQVAVHMAQVEQCSQTCLSEVAATQQALRQIVGRSEQVSDEIGAIAAVSIQQAAAAREISDHIEQIAVSAGDNVYRASQTAEVAHHLKCMVQPETVSAEAN